MNLTIVPLEKRLGKTYGKRPDSRGFTWRTWAVLPAVVATMVAGAALSPQMRKAAGDCIATGSDGAGPEKARPCDGTATWTCVTSYYPCRQKCGVAVNVGVVGLPPYCSLVVAAWCDWSNNGCTGTPDAWNSCPITLGQGGCLIDVSCDCGTISLGGWSAWLEGQFCSCRRDCTNDFACHDEWICGGCSS